MLAMLYVHIDIFVYNYTHVIYSYLKPHSSHLKIFVTCAFSSNREVPSRSTKNI